MNIKGSQVLKIDTSGVNFDSITELNSQSIKMPEFKVTQNKLIKDKGNINTITIKKKSIEKIESFIEEEKVESVNSVSDKSESMESLEDWSHSSSKKLARNKSSPKKSENNKIKKQNSDPESISLIGNKKQTISTMMSKASSGLNFQGESQKILHKKMTSNAQYSKYNITGNSSDAIDQMQLVSKSSLGYVKKLSLFNFEQNPAQNNPAQRVLINSVIKELDEEDMSPQIRRHPLNE